MAADDPADVAGDDERRYREALELRDAIREAWEGEGAPLLGAGSTGQLVEHPLVKLLREQEFVVDRLAAPLRNRHRGPNPSAVITPGIGKSPAAKLRRVK